MWHAFYSFPIISLSINGKSCMCWIHNRHLTLYQKENSTLNPILDLHLKLLLSGSCSRIHERQIKVQKEISKFKYLSQSSTEFPGSAKKQAKRSFVSRSGKKSGLRLGHETVGHSQSSILGPVLLNILDKGLEGILSSQTIQNWEEVLTPFTN